VRDPLVGRDVLIGAVAAAVGIALYNVIVLASPSLTADRPPPLTVSVFVGSATSALGSAVRFS
jgi:hypothetical protein